jgi:hypothetical protein
LIQNVDEGWGGAFGHGRQRYDHMLHEEVQASAEHWPADPWLAEEGRNERLAA